MSTPKDNPPIDYKQLAKQLDKAARKDAYSAIVNVPFEDELDMAYLFLGFICIYIVDQKSKRVCLKASSDTEQYRLAIERFKFDPAEYCLDFDKNKDNPIVQAIAANETKITTDWSTLNRGQTATRIVRLNQANSGIACSIIRPFDSKVRGALMFNYYQYSDQIGGPQETFMDRYTELVSNYLAKLR